MISSLDLFLEEPMMAATRVFVSQASCLLGDFNLSGTVDFLDINPFLSVLGSETYQCEADINTDGVVNFLDIAPLITYLAGQ